MSQKSFIVVVATLVLVAVVVGFSSPAVVFAEEEAGFTMPDDIQKAIDDAEAKVDQLSAERTEILKKERAGGSRDKKILNDLQKAVDQYYKALKAGCKA